MRTLDLKQITSTRAAYRYQFQNGSDFISVCYINDNFGHPYIFMLLLSLWMYKKSFINPWWELVKWNVAMDYDKWISSLLWDTTKDFDWVFQAWSIFLKTMFVWFWRNKKSCACTWCTVASLTVVTPTLVIQVISVSY